MKSVIIDVREPNEFSAGHVDGAINIPLSQLAQQTAHSLSEIPKDSKIIVYCRSGNRSGLAAQMLNAQGYQNVTNGINQSRVEANLTSS